MGDRCGQHFQGHVNKLSAQEAWNPSSRAAGDGGWAAHAPLCLWRRPRGQATQVTLSSVSWKPPAPCRPLKKRGRESSGRTLGEQRFLFLSHLHPHLKGRRAFSLQASPGSSLKATPLVHHLLFLTVIKSSLMCLSLLFRCFSILAYGRRWPGRDY
jgi:hypothetical protein